MLTSDWITALGPKVHGCILLDDAFASRELDFFVTLSSVSCIMGKSGQANYSAAGAFEDAFVRSHAAKSQHTRYMTMNIGAVDNTESILSLPIRQQELMRQGSIFTNFEEVYKVLEYSMSSQVVTDGAVQTIMGFDRETMTAVQDEFALANPMLSMIPYNRVSGDTSGSDEKFDVEAALRNAKSLEEAEDIITKTVAEKFAVFLARPVEDVSLDIPLPEFGMDSLVAIELKNWIVRAFHVAVQASEVTDAASITALAKTLASRSRLLSDEVRGGAVEEGDGDGGADAAAEDGKVGSADGPKLPKAPIGDLDLVMKTFLENVGHFANPEELQTLTTAVKSFTADGSASRNLYEQLAEKANDPNVDNWNHDLITQAFYLDQRDPLIFTSFTATHHDGPVSQTQEERAALIATTAFRFKQAVDAGTLETEYYFLTPLCSNSWNYLFNGTREPGLGSDTMVKYDGDYCVVFRRGHAFKVMLAENGENVSAHKLQYIFEAIKSEAQDKPVSSVGVMTADDRDSWAKVCCQATQHATLLYQYLLRTPS